MDEVRVLKVSPEMALFSDGTIVLRQVPAASVNPNRQIISLYKGGLSGAEFENVFFKNSSVEKIVERLQTKK